MKSGFAFLCHPERTAEKERRRVERVFAPASRGLDTDSVTKQTVYSSRGDFSKISPLAALGRNDTGGDIYFSIITRASKTTLFRRSSRRRSRIAPWGNARMRAPLLLFPKITLRCDFWEPFSAQPCLRVSALAGKVKPHDFYNGVP